MLLHSKYYVLNLYFAFVRDGDKLFCLEILVGSVFIFNNFNLCYHDTINWKDILSGEGAEVVIRVNSDIDTSLRGTCKYSVLTWNDFFFWILGFCTIM